MTFANPPDEELRALLKGVKTIAVVGLSPKPGRPSYAVARAMQGFGYRIVPVRPAVDSVLGEQAYASLSEVPDKIDLVDVFRAAEHIPAVVEECLALNLPAIWIQEGIVPSPQSSPGGGGGNGSPLPQAGEGAGERAAAALEKARAAGMTVVMDRCILKDYVALFT